MEKSRSILLELDKVDKSKSRDGTKSTTKWIDHDSNRYIERINKGMGKKGSNEKGTDAAHKLGWGLVNAINTHTAGRPYSDATIKEIGKKLNSEENLRIKSKKGNRKLDERRDARIACAYVTNTHIEGDSTAGRAAIAYKAAKNIGMDGITTALGNMKIKDPDSGRLHKVKNHEKYKRPLDASCYL